MTFHKTFPRSRFLRKKLQMIIIMCTPHPKKKKKSNCNYINIYVCLKLIKFLAPSSKGTNKCTEKNKAKQKSQMLYMGSLSQHEFKKQKNPATQLYGRKTVTKLSLGHFTRDYAYLKCSLFPFKILTSCNACKSNKYTQMTRWNLT